MQLPKVPRGFRLGGVHCGVKPGSTKEDLTLIVTDRNAVAAGVYTQNLVFAAPVEVDRSRTPLHTARVVVINSGNANACTGERGLEDAHRMCELAAAACEARAEQALVMSTGVIGVFLPIETIAAGIKKCSTALGRDDRSLLAAIRGMMTTDKGPKYAGRTLVLHGQEIQITGICKGAAMIGPRMATMLCVVMTDATLATADAQRVIAHAVNESFNCVSVEGHMSTNDTVLLLASGEAQAETLAGADLVEFQQSLQEVCTELACMIPDDGEGSTHLIQIRVRGCSDRDAAHRIAKTVAESALVKTAITGADPNWGRIVSAAGYAGVPFDPMGVELRVNNFLLFQYGAPVSFDDTEVSASIREKRDTLIDLRFAEGNAEIQFWTSDLTAEYVRLNSEYTT